MKMLTAVDQAANDYELKQLNRQGSGRFMGAASTCRKNITESPFELEVQPAEVYAPHTVAFGDGLTVGTAGERVRFTMQNKDVFFTQLGNVWRRS